MSAMPQEALVNPDLLVWARESINMDPEEAADRIGVKVERLLQWESGERRPTVNQARKMSEVYLRPLAAFYLPNRPGDLGFHVPHDFRRLPQDAPRALSPELVAELRRVEYQRQAALDLVVPPPAGPAEFIGTVRVGEPIPAVAERVCRILDMPMSAREGWRSEYDAFNGWRSAIEDQGVLVMHLSGVEVAEVRGVALAERAFPVIAVNGKDSPTGRVFTLLHEFVHLLLGASAISNLRISRHPRSPEQKTEQFSNVVAGEVLAPRRDLLEHELVRDVSGAVDWSEESLRRLAQHFHVSREVIVRRLLILGRTSEAFYRRQRQKYAGERRSAERGFLPMPRRIVRTTGAPFARLVIDAYHREAISSSDLAELLGARLKHLPALEALLEGHAALAGEGR